MNDKPSVKRAPLLSEDRLGERARVYGSERAILVALQSQEPDEHGPLDELEALADTAGIETLAHVVQKRRRPDPSTVIGRGKVQEVKQAARELDAEVVVFDRELSPAQARNLEEAIGRKVVDRAQLIMDIFAQRAATKEAQLQVELAQLRYLLPRLRGWGSALTRLGGGIGTRGPGETQLELDRMKISRRIHALERRLAKAKSERALRGKRRGESEVPQIVLVGYTNSGKSTLLNRLSTADAFVEDKLFATLSTTVRRGALPADRHALFVDTVGFIRALPHHLIPAFAATLEAARDADLLLHVIDVARPVWETDERIVVEILDREVFTEDTPRPQILEVWNKIDLVAPLAHPNGDHGIAVSARTGDHLDELRARIAGELERELTEVTLLVPYPVMPLLHRLAPSDRRVVIGYTGHGTRVVARLSDDVLGRLLKAGAHVTTSASSLRRGLAPN